MQVRTAASPWSRLLQKRKVRDEHARPRTGSTAAEGRHLATCNTMRLVPPARPLGETNSLEFRLVGVLHTKGR